MSRKSVNVSAHHAFSDCAGVIYCLGKNTGVITCLHDRTGRRHHLICELYESDAMSLWKSGAITLCECKEVVVVNVNVQEPSCAFLPWWATPCWYLKYYFLSSSPLPDMRGRTKLIGCRVILCILWKGKINHTLYVIIFYQSYRFSCTQRELLPNKTFVCILQTERLLHMIQLLQQGNYKSNTSLIR